MPQYGQRGPRDPKDTWGLLGSAISDWWNTGVIPRVTTTQGIEDLINRFAPGFGGPEQVARIRHGTPIPNQRPADPLELVGPGAIAKFGGLLGRMEDVAKHGVTVEAAHYGPPGLDRLLPSFYGSRPGSAMTNQEYNRVVSSGVPRVYAYTGAAMDRPEQMLRTTRYNLTLDDLYDIDADPMGLAEKVRKQVTAEAQKSKYPYTPPESEILNALERRIKDIDGYI